MKPHGILLGLISVAVCVMLFSSAVRAQSVQFPNDFFIDQVRNGACSQYFSPARLSNDLDYIAGIKSATLQSTNSLSFQHDELSLRWTRLLGISTGAAAQGDAASAMRIVASLVDIASSDSLLNALSFSNAKKKTCWAGGKSNAVCPLHVVQHTGYTAIAMIYSAIILAEFASADQRRVLDAYFAKLYKKFIAPLAEDGSKGNGLYEFADYGLGVLAYSRWTGDKRLAAREIKNRRAALSRKIRADGMIRENSYRGYRGYWYHTLGAESALGYALVARSFGQDFFRDPDLGPKLKNLAMQTIEGGQNYSSFLARSLKGKSNNVIRDRNAEIAHMHQFAVNLPLIIEKEYGARVQTAPGYSSKGASETISRLVGFNADCYYASR